MADAEREAPPAGCAPTCWTSSPTNRSCPSAPAAVPLRRWCRSARRAGATAGSPPVPPSSPRRRSPSASWSWRRGRRTAPTRSPPSSPPTTPRRSRCRAPGGSLPASRSSTRATENAAVLLADDVPVPEGDRVYELWAISDGTPERCATFRPNADGTLSVYAAGLRSGERRGVGDHRGAGRRQRHPDHADPERHLSSDRRTRRFERPDRCGRTRATASRGHEPPGSDGSHGERESVPLGRAARSGRRTCARRPRSRRAGGWRCRRP